MCLFKRKREYLDDPEVLAYVQQFIDAYLRYEQLFPEYFKHKTIRLDRTIVSFNYRFTSYGVLEVRDTYLRTTHDKDDLIDVLTAETAHLRRLSRVNMFI